MGVHAKTAESQQKAIDAIQAGSKSRPSSSGWLAFFPRATVSCFWVRPQVLLGGFGIVPQTNRLACVWGPSTNPPPKPCLLVSLEDQG